MRSTPAPFPLSKLAFMLVKQVSAPLAKRIKNRARTSPALRQWVVLPPARLYHFYDVKIRVRVAGLGRRGHGSPATAVSKVPDMTEEKTLELGSQLAAEVLLMALASLIAAREYRRHKEREAEREAESDFGDLPEPLLKVERSVDQLDLAVDKLEHALEDLSRKIVQYEEAQSKSTTS